MVSSHKKSAEWIIDQLNVENAKLVAFVLVLGFIGYHGILHLRYGEFKGVTGVRYLPTVDNNVCGVTLYLLPDEGNNRYYKTNKCSYYVIGFQ